MLGMFLLPFWLAVQDGSSVSAGQAGLRYVPPGGTPQWQSESRETPLAELVEREDGQVQLHFPRGYRMEMRVLRQPDGSLLQYCNNPGHSDQPAHVHREPQR